MLSCTYGENLAVDGRDLPLEILQNHLDKANAVQA